VVFSAAMAAFGASFSIVVDAKMNQNNKVDYMQDWLKDVMFHVY
jgi:hypothetical protein